MTVESLGKKMLAVESAVADMHAGHSTRGIPINDLLFAEDAEWDRALHAYASAPVYVTVALGWAPMPFVVAAMSKDFAIHLAIHARKQGQRLKCLPTVMPSEGLLPPE